MENGIPVRGDQERQRESRKKDARAMAMIQQGVHDSLFSRIAGAHTAKETWDILRLEFQGDTQVQAVKLQGLRRDFENLMMGEFEQVGDYFSQVMGIVSQRRSYGEALEDQKEARMNSRNGIKAQEKEKLEEQALQAFSSPKKTVFEGSSSSSRGRRRGMMRGRGRGRSQGGQERSRGPQCFLCNSQVNVSTEDNEDEVEEEAHLFLAFTPTKKNISHSLALMSNDTDDSLSRSLWFVDSGCSNHMTGSRQSFVTLDESFKLDVKLGDKKEVAVQGIGQVKVSTPDGQFKLIYDVYYAPKLEYNLLSIGQLILKGYSLWFDDDACIIINKKIGMTLLKVDQE
ncbi:uncharacterized protein LOC110881356 [Helianthus annuus]|uniref:uncharacterized protein LOC110881356 n=1 Tax=Helianthus annuus TaxID=4232 RepID=UPI000B9094CC|nr:uncharacterized protein LOC110881356 [Helianthus annuus]